MSREEGWGCPNNKGGPTKNPKIDKRGWGDYYLELESNLITHLWL